MIGVVLAHILDAKVINNEQKYDVFGGVFPKRVGARNGGISKIGVMHLEAVIRNVPGLFQAWHSFADFHINPAVGGQGAKIVLTDHFVGYNVQGKFYVFVPGHWSVKIKFFMSRVRNRALGVETMVFIRHLVVVRLAQFVVAIPGKASLLLPTVTQTR